MHNSNIICVLKHLRLAHLLTIHRFIIISQKINIYVSLFGNSTSRRLHLYLKAQSERNNGY